VTPLVIDASAGVELVADTARGRALRRLVPADAVPWVPEIFYVECGAVLRRWDLHRVLTAAQIATAVEELMTWPLRIAQVRPLFRGAWRLRANLTVPDAVYVTLAENLGGPLLTDDHKLANAPRLPVQTLRLPSSRKT
jgi:predicted nucleic acid-binding protein